MTGYLVVTPQTSCPTLQSSNKKQTHQRHHILYITDTKWRNSTVNITAAAASNVKIKEEEKCPFLNVNLAQNAQKFYFNYIMRKQIQIFKSVKFYPPQFFF